jgi:predicted nucleic acid-binding protein
MTPPRQIYLDTNIFVLFKEAKTRESLLLDKLLEFGPQHQVPLFSTSALTFSELLVKPYRDLDEGLIQTYIAWSQTTAWLTVAPITGDILNVAALLRAQRSRLKLPDAIHLATAVGLTCTHFLTADMGLETIERITHPVLGDLTMSPLTVLRPDELTLTSLLKSLAE